MWSRKLRTRQAVSYLTVQDASPPQTKMTSKDDIKGLVSLRPWVAYTIYDLPILSFSNEAFEI